MAGLMKPRRRPAYWPASAISAAQIGALALVPPRLWTVSPVPLLKTTATPVRSLASADTSGTPRAAPVPGTPAWQAGRANNWLNPPPEAWKDPPWFRGFPDARPQAVSLIQAPVAWLAVRLVPPAPRTSGSEASSRTPLTGAAGEVPVRAEERSH